MWRTPLTPVGTRASAAFQANQQANREGTKRSTPPKLKNVKRLTYEATPNSATVNKLCFQPVQAHPRGGTAASMSCRAAGAVARASHRKKN